MARFFEISIGHYINADFVVEIEKNDFSKAEYGIEYRNRKACQERRAH